MTTGRDRYAHLSDHQRRERIADVLARGVVRHLKGRHKDSLVAHSGQTRESGLDVSVKTRLHVSTSGAVNAAENS